MDKLPLGCNAVPLLHCDSIMLKTLLNSGAPANKIIALGLCDISRDGLTQDCFLELQNCKAEAIKNRKGFWGRKQVQQIKSQRNIGKKAKGILLQFQGLKLSLFLWQLDCIIPVYLSQLRVSKEKRPGFQKINQFWRQECMFKQLIFEVRGNQTYKSDFNYFGRLLVAELSVNEALVKKGLARLSLNAPKYLSVKEINHLQTILKNQKRIINKEFFSDGRQSSPTKAKDSLQKILEALGVKHKQYTRPIIRSLRSSIESFIKRYNNSKVQLLRQFYEKVSVVYYKSSQQVLKHLQVCENVRLVQTSCRGLAFFLNQIKDQELIAKIGLSNDVEILVKSVFKFLFIGNKIYHNKVFGHFTQIQAQFMNDYSTSQHSAYSQLSQSEGLEQDALSQAYSKLRFCVSSLMLALSKLFSPNLQRCWDFLFKISYNKFDLLQYLLSTNLSQKVRLQFSREFHQQLQSEFSEMSLLSAMLFQPVRKIKLNLLSLLEIFIKNFKHTRSLLMGIDKSFEQKLLKKKADKKKSFTSKSELTFLTFKLIFTAYCISFKLQVDMQVHAVLLQSIAVFIAQSKLLDKIRIAPLLTVKIYLSNYLSSNNSINNALHNVLIQTLAYPQLSQLLNNFQTITKHYLHLLQSQQHQEKGYQFFSKAMTNYSSDIKSTCGPQLQSVFTKKYETQKTHPLRLVRSLELMLRAVHRLQQQKSQPPLQQTLLSQRFLPILQQCSAIPHLEIGILISNILSNLRPCFWEEHRMHLFNFAMKFVAEKSQESVFQQYNHLIQKDQHLTHAGQYVANPRFKAMFFNLLGHLTQVKICHSAPALQFIIKVILKNIKLIGKKIPVLCKVTWTLSNWLQNSQSKLNEKTGLQLTNFLLDNSRSNNERIQSNCIRGLSLLVKLKQYELPQVFCQQIKSIIKLTLSSKFAKVRWNAFILLGALFNSKLSQLFNFNLEIFNCMGQSADLANFKVQLKFVEAIQTWLKFMKQSSLSQIKIVFERLRKILIDLKLAQYSFFQIKFVNQLRRKVIFCINYIVLHVQSSWLIPYFHQDQFLWHYVQSLREWLSNINFSTQASPQELDLQQEQFVFGLNKQKAKDIDMEELLLASKKDYKASVQIEMTEEHMQFLKLLKLASVKIIGLFMSREPEMGLLDQLSKVNLQSTRIIIKLVD